MSEEPEDIFVLFTRNPLNLSDQDIDSISSHYRELRGQYEAGIGAASRGKAKLAAKPKTELEKSLQNINFELDL